MSGWEQPSSGDVPQPSSYWAQSTAPDPLGAGQLIRGAWRLYRSARRRFLLVAAVPALIQVILSLPSLAIGLDLVRSMFEVLVDYLERVAANPEAYRDGGSLVFQAELEAQLRAVLVPDSNLLMWSALAGGLAVAIGLVGTAAMTSTALASAAGRPIPTAFAFRLVAAKAGLVKPILAIGIGWVVVSWLPLLLQTSSDFQTWAGAPGSPRSTLIASLLSVLALVVFVGIVFLAVRWALYIPAVLVEALGVGPGLARSAQLSRGIRVRLGLAMAGLIILLAIAIGIVALVLGFAVGIGTGSVEAGFIAYVVADLVGNVLAAPLVPAVLALAYRERTREPGPASATDPAPG